MVVYKTHEWRYVNQYTMYHGREGDEIYYIAYNFYCPHCGAQRTIRAFWKNGLRLFFYAEAGRTSGVSNLKDLPCKHRELVS